MTEADVTLTDYDLTLECGVFVSFLARLPIHPGIRKSELIGFFLSIAVAAATGGTVHGFFRDEWTLGYKVLWRATLMMIGMTALCGVRIGTAMLMPDGAAAYVNSCASILFVVYALTALFLWQDFRVAIIGYLPSLLVLGAGFLVQYHLLLSGIFVAVVSIFCRRESRYAWPMTRLSRAASTISRVTSGASFTFRTRSI